MASEADRYFDFSEDEQLIAEFDPEGVSDVILQIHGGVIQKHLRFRNPISALKGLISYQILAAETHSDTWNSIGKAMSHIRLILGVNTAAVLYLAYVLSQL